jgi:omega-amidase
MAKKIRIGLIQREITPHDPAGNLLATLEMIGRVADQEVDIFVLSELWSTGLVDPVDGSSVNLAETVDGPTVDALREFCVEHSTHILAGTLPLLEDNRLTNTALMINPSGEIILKYSKIHLFTPMGEAAVFEAGNTLSACAIDGVGIGVLICYDLRFPGLCRRLAHAGCELILVPALWPEARIEAWELMLRARASENQIFIVGANGLMSQNGMFFPGHSMMVGPMGEAVNSPEMRESAIVRMLDIDKVREVRRTLCYIDDERETPEVNWTSRVNESGG